MSRMLSYEKKNTWIHELSGISKLLFFLLWTMCSMLTYDLRILVAMTVLSIVIFAMSKTQWRQVGSIFIIILVFLVLNMVMVFIFSPYHGCELWGSKTVLFHIAGNYDMTREQLLYQGCKTLKYCTIVPAAFMFLTTTDPSEFAASLNMIGISYNIAYSVAITLRYIPDVQKEFVSIKNAQASRGIEMSAKASMFDRIKNTAAIIFPLIFSSMERIDVVSNAMELRGYGKHKKRTWYSYKTLRRNDYLTIAFSIVFFAVAMGMTFIDGNRYLY